MRRSLSRPAAMLAAATCVACAAHVPLEIEGEAAFRARRAAEALRRDDLDAARTDLAWLSTSCDAREYRRDALLPLATLLLDPATPDRSPASASSLAAIYMLLPDAEVSGLPLARSLYRLAADAGAGGLTTVDTDARHADHGFDPCGTVLSDPFKLPRMSGSTPTRAHLHELEVSISARDRSLSALEAHVDSLEAHASALEAELRRITSLLRTGAATRP